MKNKASENNELENLLRKGLENVAEKPDAGTWEQLAARQAPKNRWLKIQHYGLYSLPVIALLAIGLGWWYFNQASTEPTPQPGENKPPTEQAQEPVVPVAELQTPESPEIVTPAQTPPKLQRLNSVPASTVRFAVRTGLDYENPATGTRVRIPASALVDSKGRPVQGVAELTIREYRDIPDFLASGIPMHYADDRGSFFFNSGGMFDVRVTQNGEPLALAPGETYDVEFSPTGELTNTSLYFFDEQAGAWRYQPDPAFSNQNQELAAAKGQDLPPVVAENLAVQNNRASAQLPCMPQLPELPVNADPALWMQKGVQTGYDLATSKLKMPGWFLKRPYMTSEQLLNGMERGLIRIVRNRDMGELFFPEDLNNVFTELKAFKDCYFTRSTDTADVDKQVLDDTYWDRVAIKQEIGNRCLVSLFSEKEGLLQFYAILTASIGNKNFDANRVFAEYNRLRTERQENFESLVQNLRYFLYTAPAFQAEDEWCMSHPEWLEYFEAQHPMMAKRYGAQLGLCADKELAAKTWSDWRARAREHYFARAEQVRNNARTIASSNDNLRYALRLTAFGLYNCDQIFRLGSKQPEYIYAAYKTETGDRVYASTVSVLERNTRLFFTLPEANKIIRVPGRALDVIITDREGKQYHLSAEQYARLSQETGASNTFTVTDITEKTRTPRDWATYLDM